MFCQCVPVKVSDKRWPSTRQSSWFQIGVSIALKAEDINDWSRNTNSKESTESVDCNLLVKNACVCKYAICLPTEHQGVHKNSFRNVRAFQIELEFRSVSFCGEGGNRSTRRKTSRSRVENQQQNQPTYDAGSGNRTQATLVGGEHSHHCANPAPSPGKSFIYSRNN